MTANRAEYTRAAVRAVLNAHDAGEDVAGWAAEVFCRAAAQLGTTEALLSRRPGSWEAGHVRRLMNGTVGEDNADLSMYREEGDSADS